MTFDEAMVLAGKAVHGDDGRGMIGQNRRHLKQRVARAIMKQAAQAPKPIIPNGGYTVERHGNGYAIYRGRTMEHHGENLGHLTECLPHLPEMIEKALNAPAQAPASDEVELVAWLLEFEDEDGIGNREVFYSRSSMERHYLHNTERRGLTCKVTSLYTHPPAKVPEAEEVAEKVTESLFSIRDGVYRIQFMTGNMYCEAGAGGFNKDAFKQWLRAQLSDLLTTPTPATKPETGKEYDPADDPLFQVQGPDVTVEQALDAMEDECQLDEKHCYTTPEAEACVWREDEGIWSGECGVSWWFEDGTPKENKQNFCPNCGKPCVPHEPQEQ